MLIRCIDFETTGTPSETEKHAICEVGWCDVTVNEGEAIQRPILGMPVYELTNPLMPIPATSRAVHHISDDMVKFMRSPDAVLGDVYNGNPSHFCAHNASFENKFFMGNLPWICTYKVAMRLWPEAESYSLQVLRYWLDLEIDQDIAMPPHRAGPDAYLGAGLMKRCLEEDKCSIDDMVRWSSGPALLPKITFGKHKGSKWENVPTDYLDWLANKSDMDNDVKANARHHLKQRGR